MFWLGSLAFSQAPTLISSNLNLQKERYTPRLWDCRELSKRQGEREMIVLIALLFSATIIGPSLQEPKRESIEMDQTITFTPLNASEHAILDAHMDDLANRSRFYRYDLKGVPWEFEAIRCQLIQKHMLLKGKSLNDMHPSEFVAVIPYAAGDIKIIPLWHGSLRTFGDPYQDPHNLGIF